MSIKIKTAVGLALLIMLMTILFVLSIYFLIDWKNIDLDIDRIMLISAATLLVASLISTILVRGTIDKMIELKKSMIAAENGNFAVRATTDENHNNEINELVGTFNKVVKCAEEREKKFKHWRNMSMKRELKMIELKKQIRKFENEALEKVLKKDSHKSSNDETLRKESNNNSDVNNINITQKLKKQHKAIIDSLREIDRLTNNTTGNADKIHSKLKDCVTYIKKHLQVEDSEFYPIFLKKMEERDIDTKETHAFISGMNGIADFVLGFFDKYYSARSITENESQFKNDFLGIVSILGSRIEAEENGVYEYWNTIK